MTTTILSRRARALCAIVLAASLAGCASTAPVGTRVGTASGPVDGVDDSARSGTLHWKGIPYAKPPVGDLRWRPPVAVDAWTSARRADRFGNACVQFGRIYGPGGNNRFDPSIGATLNQAVGSEDCLYLNVWRPASAGRNLPVIVFVHGGSNVSGYTADPWYDGANLARAANAVVVTVNYRLGIFGFLSLPQLKTGTDPVADSGNFALLDVMEALRWVSRNADRFGGDPGNVTLMGQSAGASNVMALVTSPAMVAASPRLFHRAFPISGFAILPTDLPAPNLPWVVPAPMAAAQGQALLAESMVADGRAADAAAAGARVASMPAAEVTAYLRSKPPADLFRTLLTKLGPAGRAGSGPIADGTIVATDPVGAIRAGRYVKVPLLLGTTRDEATLFPSLLPMAGGTGTARAVTDAQLFAHHFAHDPDAPAATRIEDWITPGYLPADAPVTGFTARARTLTSLLFDRARDLTLDAVRSQQPQVWYYRFDWDEQPAPWNVIYGATHAGDLPFLFGNFGPSLFSRVSFSAANRPGRVALSDAMMRSTAAFAWRGDPNDPSLGIAWAPWPGRIVFDASTTQARITAP